jgi:hypothetical protein
MTFLGEGTDNYQFGCYSCGGTRVITKARTTDAAKHFNKLKRDAEAVQQQRSGVKRSYSFGK